MRHTSCVAFSKPQLCRLTSLRYVCLPSSNRLAALDLLRAEQMRAYSTHLAVHGPMFVPPVAGMQPAYAMPPMPAQAHAPSAPRASVASTSSHRSRAPSLSNSVGTSRSSSSPLLSPEEEGARLSGPDRGTGVVVMTARDHTAYNTLALPALALDGSGSAGTSSAQRKRPRASIEDEAEHAAALRAVSATTAGAVKASKAKAARVADVAEASRRTSPTLPGIRSLDLPPLDSHAHAQSQRMPAFHSSTRSPPRSSAHSASQVEMHYRSAPARSAEHDGATSEAVAAAAKGLQHLLNSGTSTRVATSDMRSSSASDEE